VARPRGIYSLSISIPASVGTKDLSGNHAPINALSGFRDIITPAVFCSVKCLTLQAISGKIYPARRWL